MNMYSNYSAKDNIYTKRHECKIYNYCNHNDVPDLATTFCFLLFYEIKLSHENALLGSRDLLTSYIPVCYHNILCCNSLYLPFYRLT